MKKNLSVSFNKKKAAAWAGVIVGVLSLAYNYFNPKSAETSAGIQDLVQMSVTVRAGGASGSGTLFAADNEVYVLTAAHVVDGATVFTVEQDDLNIAGKRYAASATLLRACKDEDVAVLHIPAPATLPGRKFAKLASSTPSELGAPLCHVGSIFGSIGSQTWSLGRLAKRHRNLDGQPRFQFDGTADSGSSGGGVFNSAGELVGIVAQGVSFTNLAYCVPVETILAVAKREGFSGVFFPLTSAEP